MTNNPIKDADDQAIAAAYQYCRELSSRHYENFPVASLFLPAHLRASVTAIYAFARTADDFADEAAGGAEKRLALLRAYREQLLADDPSTTNDPVFVALADTRRRFELPIQLFDDLLTAFIQDVEKHRYNNFDSVLDYCRHSANPIGRLMLLLFGIRDENAFRQSDAICSALQLINFWQDLGQDYDENNRIYVPLDEMTRYGVTERHFREKISDHAMGELMALQRQRARALLLSGVGLIDVVPRRLAWQLRLTVSGGLTILNALDRNAHDVFARPRLRRRDWVAVIWRAIFFAGNST